MDKDSGARYPRGTDQIGRNANTALTKLWRAAVRLERLQTLLQATLPDDIQADQVRVASIRGPVLTLVVSSSAWAARLRFDVPVMLERLAGLSDFQGVQQIRLQVGQPPVLPGATGEDKVERPRSGVAAATLRDCAAGLPDGELRATLLALARHHDAS